MKQNLLLAMTTLAIMSACSNNEVLKENENQKQSSAISFKEAFVDKATRIIDPSYTSAGSGTEGNVLKDFVVYGTIAKDGSTANIYNGVTVTYSDTPDPTAVPSTGGWAYSEEYIQYWVEGNTYQFMAFAPASAVTSGAISAVTMDANGFLPVSLMFDVSKQVDLLYH